MAVQPQEVTGAWGSIDNLLFGKQPARGSGFFGASQYESIRSETTEPAGATGWTFRPTDPENPSMRETQLWSDLGWIGSPYQDDKAIPVKVAEGKQLAATVEPKKDVLAESLEWALGAAQKAAVLYNEIKTTWSPREVTVGTPRAGYPEGRDVQHTNDLSQRSADVFETGKILLGQVKGLFSLGYPQTTPQPAAALDTTTPKIGVGMIAIVALLILLLGK